MENFIMDLYAGQFYHETIQDEELLKERNSKLDEVISLEEELCKNLSQEQQELFKKILMADGEVWTMESDFTFAKGIKIGMQLQRALDKIKL